MDGGRRPTLMTPNEASEEVPEREEDFLAAAAAQPSQAKGTKKKKSSKSKKHSKHKNPLPSPPASTISTPTTPISWATGAETPDDVTLTLDDDSGSATGSGDVILAAADDYDPFGPLPGAPPSIFSPSAPVASPWPAGMPPPTSPLSAGRQADAERGGLRNGATYAPPPVIDPDLLFTPRRPGPRPCYRGADFPSNRNASNSPTQIPATISVGGFHFPAIPSSRAGDKSPMVSLFDSYRAHVAASPVRSTASPGPLSAHLQQPVFPHDQQPVSSQPTPPPVGLPSPTPPPAVSPSVPAPTVPSASVPSGPGASASVAAAGSQPVYFQSRPRMNRPKLKKAAQGKLEGVKAAASKVAAKKAAERMAAGRKAIGKQQQQMAPLADVTNAFSLETVPPVPAAAPLPTGAPPALVHTMGNETRDFNRRIDAEKAHRDAEKAREAARLHNPAGGADLVIIPCPARERKAPARPDAEYVPKTTKLSRAQQLAAKNNGCLEKLLARGKK